MVDADEQEELMAYVLPWAKAHKPEAYAATMKPEVVNAPKVFGRFLTRLLELRYAADPRGVRAEVPVRWLDATALQVDLRDRRSGTVLRVCGALAPTPHVWRFKELVAIDREGFDSLQAAKSALDLEHA